MQFGWISLLLSTILVLIDCKGEQNSTKSFNKSISVVTKSNETADRSEGQDLLTDDQNYNYHYVKNSDDSLGDKYDDQYHSGKSYLKEVHYFHDKEVEYEKKHDWDSDRESVSKKVKKDLYNKRNNGKYQKYGIKDDIIEVNKWDDNEFNGPYDHYNHQNGYHSSDNSGGDKNQISVYTDIHHKNNDDDYNYKIDVNRDADNYAKYNPREGVPERRPPRDGYGGGQGGGGRGHNQKWFTNVEEDKDESGSVDIEVKDQDNYNNYNSPKFIVNFHTFKPWNRLRNRRQEDNYESPVDNTDNDLDIYVDDSADATNDDKNYGRNYRPKMLTNLSPKLRHEKSDNNYANYDNRNDRDVKYKAPVHKEMVYKAKQRPKSVRYHYEKRVMPQVYPKPDHYGDDRYPPARDQMNRKFIETPYDTFNTGWSSVQKPMRHMSEEIRTPVHSVAQVKQYRYGF